MGVERFGVALNGDVLRHKMAERGLTGAALAKGTGLSEGTISNALAPYFAHGGE